MRQGTVGNQSAVGTLVSKTNSSNRSATNSPLVMLINIPWGRIDRPSVQLGILQSVLMRAGIRTEARSFNLTFLDYIVNATAHLPAEDRICLNDYCDVGEDDRIVGLGDLIFAVPPFQDSSQRDEQYLNYVRSSATPAEILAKAVRMHECLICRRDYVPRYTPPDKPPPRNTPPDKPPP